VALVIGAANMLLDWSVSSAVDEKMSIAEDEGPHGFYESRYGDFEGLVSRRRHSDLLKIFPPVRADDHKDDWETDLQGRVICLDGAHIDPSYKDFETINAVCRSQQDVDDLAVEHRDGGAFDTSDGAPHYGRSAYANGFIEEYWAEQRCNS
jgi:hypothetical protein